MNKYFFIGFLGAIVLLGITLYIKEQKIEILEAEKAFLISEKSKVEDAYSDIAKKVKELEANRDKINQELLKVTQENTKKYSEINKSLECEKKLMEYLKRSNNVL